MKLHGGSGDGVVNIGGTSTGANVRGGVGNTGANVGDNSSS